MLEVGQIEENCALYASQEISEFSVFFSLACHLGVNSGLCAPVVINTNYSTETRPHKNHDFSLSLKIRSNHYGVE